MKISPEVLKTLSIEAALMPQEEMLEVGKKKKRLYIGIPRETSFQETRVALVPDAVALLVSNGHEVVVETNAGKAANFTDKDYSEAGAKISYDVKEVYKADIIMKVAPPSLEEIEMMQRKQTLFSALQLSVQNRDSVKKLMDKKITAIAWDFIRDEEGSYPVVRSMGELAGTASVLIAGEYLSNVNKGKGLLMGGISGVPPADVVVLGAGTVGEFATRSALGLGAIVKVFDTSISRLRRLQNDLSQRVYTSIVQPNIIAKALSMADVVIGAMRAEGGKTPCIVTEKMMEDMKPGSVVVDVSIDKGGCFETSEVTNHTKPVFVKHGIVHYCVPNIASRYARTASFALSNIFAPILLQMADEGGSESIIKRKKGFRNGVYLLNGTLTKRVLGEAFKLPFKDIDLLTAAL
ncbi:MAG TPA: alanine dehydrogenase [Flavobacteriales bacterium]|nr:alanine dehydrogenase [Flavobacteriales bacterium]